MKATGKLDYLEMPATGATLDRAKAFYSQRLRLGVHRLRPDLRSLQRRIRRRVPGRHGGSIESAAAGALFGGSRRDACRRPGGDGVILKPIFNFPGGRRFHFRDPAGNELAVWGPDFSFAEKSYDCPAMRVCL